MAAAGQLLSIDDLARIAGRNPGPPRRVVIDFHPPAVAQIIVPAVAGRFLWCEIVVLVFGGATVAAFQDGAGTNLSGFMNLAGQFPHQFERGIYTEAVNQPIILNQPAPAGDLAGYAIVRSV